MTLDPQAAGFSAMAYPMPLRFPEMDDFSDIWTGAADPKLMVDSLHMICQKIGGAMITG